jgi:hypothetical protein
MTSIYNSYNLLRKDTAPKKPATINDDDREGFVNNDEGWYNYWRSSRVGIRRFVRANRPDIDASMRAQGY